MLRCHFPRSHFFVDLGKDTVKLRTNNVSVTMIKQVVGVGQQLQCAVTFFDRNRLSDVFTDVQDIADLTQRHQEFDQTYFTAVFALCGTYNAHLGVGRTTKETTDR